MKVLNFAFAGLIALSGLGIHSIVNKAVANSKDADWKREQILIHIAQKQFETRDFEGAALSADAAILLNASNSASRNLKAAALNKLERVDVAPGPKPDQVPKEIWEGKLKLGRASLRVVFRVFEMEDGSLAVLMDSPDQGARGMIVDAATFEEDRVRFEVSAVEGIYEGTKTEDGAVIEGQWSVGGAPFPLVLRRAEEAPGSPPTP